MAELPKGQRARTDFPRFGLDKFADRLPVVDEIGVRVSGALEDFELTREALSDLERVEQVSDFHCVTTWSSLGLVWSGYRMSDVWEKLIEPRTKGSIEWLVVRSADGFRARLRLDDALAPDVLLADSLHGEPLSIEHGGPLRLVAPAHYGYKSPKYITEMVFAETSKAFKMNGGWDFMEHPRARVALEERGGLPGWFLRYLYRPLIGGTVRKFNKPFE